MKHAYEAPSVTAHGVLLGLDLDGTLEVSNSFPLPYHSHDDDEKSTKVIGVFFCCESRLRFVFTPVFSALPDINAALIKRGAGR